MTKRRQAREASCQEQMKPGVDPGEKAARRMALMSWSASRKVMPPIWFGTLQAMGMRNSGRKTRIHLTNGAPYERVTIAKCVVAEEAVWSRNVSIRFVDAVWEAAMSQYVSTS
jgi:hypothetical protein